MRHIKSIVIVIVITFIVGVVVWNVMWMNEVKRQLKAHQSLNESTQKAQAKDKIPVALVRKNPYVFRNTKHNRNNPDKLNRKEQLNDITSDVRSYSPRKETESALLEESEALKGDYHNRVEIDSRRKYRELAPDPGKTIIIAQNEKIMTISERNHSQQQTMKSFEKIAVGTTPHPTSTVPE